MTDDGQISNTINSAELTSSAELKKFSFSHDSFIHFIFTSIFWNDATGSMPSQLRYIYAQILEGFPGQMNAL